MGLRRWSREEMRTVDHKNDDEIVKLDMKLRASAEESKRVARTVLLCVVAVSASFTSCQYAPHPACTCHNQGRF